MRKCHALTKKGTFRAPCKNGIKSGATIDHDGHLHYLCGPHFDQHQKNPDNLLISTMACEEAKETPHRCPICGECYPTPLILEMHMDEYEHNGPTQPTLDMEIAKTPNTKGLFNVEQLREIMSDNASDFGFEVEKQETSIMLTGTTEIVDETAMLEEMIRILLKFHDMYGNIRVISGGAVGADRLWALAAHKITTEHGIKIPFDIYVPVGYEDVFIKKDAKNQYRLREFWQEHMRRFGKMLELADNVYDQRGKPRGRGRYVKGSNYTRNITMVEAADVAVIVSETSPKDILAVKKGESGFGRGTFHGTRCIFAAGIEDIFWINNTEAPATVKVNRV